MDKRSHEESCLLQCCLHIILSSLRMLFNQMSLSYIYVLITALNLVSVTNHGVLKNMQNCSSLSFTFCYQNSLEILYHVQDILGARKWSFNSDSIHCLNLLCALENKITILVLTPSWFVHSVFILRIIRQKNN